MRQLGLKVRVTDVKNVPDLTHDNTDDNTVLTLSYVSYNITVDYRTDALFLVVVTGAEQYTLEAWDYVDGPELCFSFAHNTVNTKLAGTELKGFIIAQANSYNKKFQLTAFPGFSNDCPLSVTSKTGDEETKEHPIEISGNNSCPYPLFETVYWASQICERRTTRESLSQNLACLGSHPGISFQ